MPGWVVGGNSGRQVVDWSSSSVRRTVVGGMVGLCVIDNRISGKASVGCIGESFAIRQPVQSARTRRRGDFWTQWRVL